VRNSYELRLRNMTGFDRDLRVSVESGEPMVVELQGVEGDSLIVPADATFRQRVYLTSPGDSAASRGALTPVELVVEDAGGGRQVREETVFTGTGQ
jgi:hypothetical protein